MLIIQRAKRAGPAQAPISLSTSKRRGSASGGDLHELPFGKARGFCGGDGHKREGKFWGADAPAANSLDGLSEAKRTHPQSGKTTFFSTLNLAPTATWGDGTAMSRVARSDARSFYQAWTRTTWHSQMILSTELP